MRHAFQPAVRATSLAAGLVFSLSGLAAHAATTAEMAKIKLYGNVTIAQDSVQSWGPWEQFEAPAAGNQPSVPTFGSDASNLYRPIGPVNPPVPPTPPAVGSIEGFATFTQFDNSSESLIGSSLATVVGSYSLTNVNVSSDPVTTLPAFVSGSFTPHTALGTAGPLLLSNTGTLNLVPNSFLYSSADGQTNAIPISIEGIDSNAIQAWAFIVNYANGSNVPSAVDAQDAGPIFGVVGVRTSAADMAALRSGNFVATYQGTTLANAFAFNMNVNFGNSTFNAKVADSNLNVTYGFSGGVNGSTVASTRVYGAGGATVAGGLAGFFTGNKAAGFIGNVNVRSTDGTPSKFTLNDSVIAKQTSLTQAGGPR